MRLASAAQGLRCPLPPHRIQQTRQDRRGTTAQACTGYPGKRCRHRIDLDDQRAAIERPPRQTGWSRSPPSRPWRPSPNASGSRPAVRPASGERVRTCFSAAQTRERIAAGGLADPFGLMRAKARELRAEAISVKLCETGGALVYQIDFLRPDGRLVHALFEAATGKAWVARDLGARPEK